MVKSVCDVYVFRVSRMEGDFGKDEDWVGSMDPYIKFKAMNRDVYTTQKL